jgi:hypothetical protein
VSRGSERAREVIDKRGVTTSFLWGLSEATLFFVVPDVAVGAVALFGWRRGLKAAAAAIVGAVLGGVALYLVARGMGAGVRDLIDRLPGIPHRFFAETRDAIADDGGAAIVAGPSRGVPYKVYAAEWALAGRGGLDLIAWTVPARAARIVPAALISSLTAAFWRRRFGEWRVGLLLLLYLAVWVVIYTVYFARVGF